MHQRRFCRVFLTKWRCLYRAWRMCPEVFDGRSTLAQYIYRQRKCILQQVFRAGFVTSFLYRVQLRSGHCGTNMLLQPQEFQMFECWQSEWNNYTHIHRPFRQCAYVCLEQFDRKKNDNINFWVKLFIFWLDWWTHAELCYCACVCWRWCLHPAPI